MVLMPDLPLKTTAQTREAFYGKVKVSTFIMPARTAFGGGDWCEAFLLGDGILALSIGDVSGHGIAKYPRMLQMRRIIREAALAHFNPAQVLLAANRYLCEFGVNELASALFVHIDLLQQTFSFANAGHPPPLLASAQAHFLDFWQADLLLGVDPNLSLKLRHYRLRPRSVLVLYSDGVSEYARDPIEGESELAAVLTESLDKVDLSATTIAERMRLNVSNRDDVAILTAQMPGDNLAAVLDHPLAVRQIPR